MDKLELTPALTEKLLPLWLTWDETPELSREEVELAIELELSKPQPCRGWLATVCWSYGRMDLFEKIKEMT